MKIVIIEDEKAAVRNLTSLLNEIKPNGEIVTILDSISSTIEWFSSHPMPELVFMAYDISQSVLSSNYKDTLHDGKVHFHANRLRYGLEYHVLPECHPATLL